MDDVVDSRTQHMSDLLFWLLLSFGCFSKVVVFCSSRVAYLSVNLSPFFGSYEIRW